MDPVTLVVTALAAGAAAGITGAANQAVTDAYENLKSLVVNLLRRSGAPEQASQDMVNNVAGSQESKAPVAEALQRTEVDQPTQDAAQKLLELLDAAQRGKFQVDASQAKGVIVGDHATQHNTFH